LDNVKYAFYENDFVNYIIGYKDDKLVSLKLVKENNIDSIKNSFSDFVNNQLEEYFNQERKVFDIPLLLDATGFQKKVYFALLNIEYGKTKSYKDIAIEINNPKAYRAVGLANNKNPIPIVIPCHRVISSNKKLTGYAYGLDMKRRLLNLEGCILTNYFSQYEFFLGI
jgi:O-6-methylguanine DNA methyltransferase